MDNQTYSIEELGQRVRSRDPQSFGGFSDQEIGQRMLERHPELKNMISDSYSNNQPSVNYSDSQDYSSPHPAQSDGFLKSVVKSVARPFAEVGTSAYNVGSSIKKLAGGDVQGAAQALEQKRNIPFLGETKPAFTGQESTLEAAKKIGGYGAEIGSTIIPAGEIGTGFKAVAKGATRFAGASALGELGSQLEQGKNLNVGDIIKSAAIGAAIPVVGRGANKLAKGVGNVSADLLGKTTGTSGDVVREAFKNPNVIKFARQAGTKGGADLQKQALEEAQQGFQKLVKNKGEEYIASLEKIKANPQELQGILPDLKNKLDQHLENYDIKVGEGGKLDFSNSALDHSNALQKAYNTVNSWTDMSAAGIDRLKKKLGQFADQVPSTEQRGGIANIINDLKISTKQHLNTKVPGYQEMTSKYAQASDLHDEIKKALSLGDNASQDTAIRKLMSTVRDNNDLRKEFVNTLSGASGSDITGKLAGAALSPTIARGLSGKIATGAIGAGGIAHFLQPSAVPLIGAYVAASSPRLVGELTNLVSKATRPMIAANKFSPQIQNGLRILLQRSLSE